jgi:hypothetical protein
LAISGSVINLGTGEATHMDITEWFLLDSVEVIPQEKLSEDQKQRISELDPLLSF